VYLKTIFYFKTMKQATLFQVLSLILLVGLINGLTSCKKEDDPEVDSRAKYVGAWNFKTTVFHYSGYYDYNVPPGSSPIWVTDNETTVSENDSTGSVVLGPGENQLTLKYCSTCSERIIDLDQNGKGSWIITDDTFFDDVQPSPPGCPSAYTTIRVDGEKL
jgi:hypothetical protein